MSQTAPDAEVIRRLQAEVKRHGSQAKWAKAHGFSRGFVSFVLAGSRGVSERLAAALGFERVSAWKRKGK